MILQPTRIHTINPLPPKKPRKKVGLGDAVAMVAQPTAEVIDKLVGTSLAKCGGCAQRKETLNGAIPDITKPFSK